MIGATWTHLLPSAQGPVCTEMISLSKHTTGSLLWPQASVS